MVNTEYIKKGVERLQEIEKLLDDDFFSELSDRQEEYNGLHSDSIRGNVEDYTDAEANLVWVADCMDFYKERIKDLQKVLLGELSSEIAEERILGALLDKANAIKEIMDQEPKMIDGIPHYKVCVGESDDDSETLLKLAAERTEIIVDHLDYSAGKASVTFWTNGMPELIYISTFSLNDEGIIEESRDMSSSTI